MVQQFPYNTLIQKINICSQMNQESFSSQSANFFNSSLNQSSSLGYNFDSQPRKGQLIQQIQFDPNLLQQNDVLFDEFALLMGERSLDEDMRQVCQEFIMLRRQQQAQRLSQRKFTQSEKKGQGTKETQNIFKVREQVQKQINNLQQQKEQQIKDLNSVMRQNRRMKLNISVYKKFIKHKLLDNQSKIFESDKTTIRILTQMLSTNNDQQLRNKPKIQDQTRKYQTEHQEIKKLVEAQQKTMQKIKQSVDQYKRRRQETDQVVGDSTKINLKRNVLLGLINQENQKNVESRNKFSSNLNSDPNQNMNNIKQLSSQILQLKSVLKSYNGLIKQKQNKQQILQKRLSVLIEQKTQIQAQKQIKEKQRGLNGLERQQNQNQKVDNELHKTSKMSNLLSNQQILLQTYSVNSTNRLREENNCRLKINQQRRKEQQPSELNKGSNFSKNLIRVYHSLTSQVFPSIKSYKQLLNWLLSIWLGVLAYYLMSILLIRQNSQLLEIDGIASSINKKTRTIVHHYQIKNNQIVVDLQGRDNQSIDEDGQFWGDGQAYEEMIMLEEVPSKADKHRVDWAHVIREEYK